jgi:hypothetical protein
MICVADAVQFFSLPRHIQTKGDSLMVDGPELTISIKRGGMTKTVEAYDPSNLRNRDDVARFHRVWDRIFKPLPLKPAWPGHLTIVGGGAVMIGSVAAGARRQCAPAALRWRFRAAPELHR